MEVLLLDAPAPSPVTELDVLLEEEEEEEEEEAAEEAVEDVW